MRLKQRITRILIEEIIADVDEAASEIVLMIHWTGGRHSELRVKKNLYRSSFPLHKSGGHRNHQTNGRPFPGRSDCRDSESTGVENRFRQQLD